MEASFRDKDVISSIQFEAIALAVVPDVAGYCQNGSICIMQAVPVQARGVVKLFFVETIFYYKILILLWWVR
jgi:hypothetical protein